MATPFILTNGQLYVDPRAPILRAKEYCNYVESKRILREAHSHADIISKQSHEKYLEEKERGYDEGVDQSKVDQADHMLRIVENTVDYLASIEKVMAELLVTSVKKIINDFDQEELAIGLVKKALQNVRNEKKVTVRLPTTQYAMVKAKLNDLLGLYKGIGFIELVADQRLSTGDCILESEIGIIDASVDVQLKALQKRFEQVNSEIISHISQEVQH